MASGGPGQQDLLNALHALYHNEDPAVKEQANKWLEQWQATQQAWSISDGVLHDPNSTMEAQYFCAQTLRTKVLCK
jgi:transportin-3